MRDVLRPLLEARSLVTGYKVMRINGGRAISGANSRLSFPLKRGSIIRFPGDGIWLSLNKQYVIDYYAVHDRNVLLTLKFDKSDIVHGNPNDRDTELSVKGDVRLVDFKVL